MSEVQEQNEPDAAVDALAVTVLCAIAFLPLWTSFAGIGWIVVASISVLTGLLVAAGVKAMNWPGAMLVLAVMGAFVIIGIPAQSLDQQLGQMLPTPDSLGELFRNVGRCWGELLGTLPRIDSAGPVMLIPVILGLVGASLAMGLAVFTSSAGMPVVPLVCVLATSLALGRGDAMWQWLPGVGFATVALIWVTLRGRQLDSSRQRISPRQVLAAALVVALATGVAWQFEGSVAGDVPRLKLRETAARGIDTTKYQTPLRNFRRFTKQPQGDRDNVYDVILMRVQGAKKGDRLRFAVLDWYDGEQWRPNPDRSPQNSMARYLRLSSTIDNPSPGDKRSVLVEVRRAWRLNWVPTMGALQSFDFRNYESNDRREDLTYNPATSTALLQQVLRGVDDYEFTAKVPNDNLDKSMTAASGVDEELYLRASYLDAIARAYRAQASTRMEALFVAAAALKRSGRYTDGASKLDARRYPPGHGLDRLDVGFLHAPQMAGNDEQYAATMALLAIRLGIPARVVVGAKVPARPAIRGKHVQAWIEVQTKDGMWRTLPTEAFMGKKPPKSKLPKNLPPDFSSWEPPPPRDQPLQEEQTEPEVKKKKTKEPVKEERSVPWWLIVVAMIAGAIPGAKFLRRRHRRTRGRASARIVGGWNELTDHARDLGADWMPGRTRPEEARQVGTSVALAERADAAIYAGPEPDEAEIDAFWELVAQARSERGEGLPRWRRILAPFNPITLLRRR